MKKGKVLFFALLALVLLGSSCASKEKVVRPNSDNGQIIELAGRTTSGKKLGITNDGRVIELADQATPRPNNFAGACRFQGHQGSAISAINVSAPNCIQNKERRGTSGCDETASQTICINPYRVEHKNASHE